MYSIVPIGKQSKFYNFSSSFYKGTDSVVLDIKYLEWSMLCVEQRVK